MQRRSAVVPIAVAILGSLAQPRSHSDPIAPLAGTWGQPPIDGKPGLTGSIFTADRGQPRRRADRSDRRYRCVKELYQRRIGELAAIGKK